MYVGKSNFCNVPFPSKEITIFPEEKEKPNQKLQSFRRSCHLTDVHKCFHCVHSTWAMSLWNRNIYLVNWKTLLRPYAVRIHVANVSFSNYLNNLWFARFEAQRPRVQHQSNVLIPYEWRLYENSSVLFHWMEILWGKKVSKS